MRKLAGTPQLEKTIVRHSNVEFGGLGTIDAEREARVAFLRHPDDSAITRFDGAVLHIDSAEVRASLMRGWEYAQSLDYHHPGQSKELYLAHPLRVASLYLRIVRPIEEAGAVTAILHNVMEVTNVQVDELTRIVGGSVANAISTLTVDRERQWESEYKNDYYKKIEGSPEFVQHVKIMDKLDNLFVLCLNPSEQIRTMYLNEIEKWLLPMTRRALPQIADYLRELVKDNRRIGYKSS